MTKIAVYHSLSVDNPRGTIGFYIPIDTVYTIRITHRYNIKPAISNLTSHISLIEYDYRIPKKHPRHIYTGSSELFRALLFCVYTQGQQKVLLKEIREVLNA